MADHRPLGEAIANLALANSPVVMLVSGTVTLKPVFLNAMKIALEVGNAVHRSPPHNLVHISSIPFSFSAIEATKQQLPVRPAIPEFALASIASPGVYVAGLVSVQHTFMQRRAKRGASSALLLI